MTRNHLGTWIIIFFLVFISSKVFSETESTTAVLVVGSNTSYDPKLSPLKYAVKDALRFAKTMESAGAIKTNAIKILVDISLKDFDEKVTAFIRQINASQGVSKFIFYFSGHADSLGLHLKDGMISKAHLHKLLKLVQVKTKVALLDSCFAGAIARKGISRSSKGFEIPKIMHDEPSGTIFLTASTETEAAFESDDIMGSVFSHYLVEGLYGRADNNRDGLVSIDEIYAYVYRQSKLQALVFPSQGQQKPEIVADLRGQGNVIMSFPQKISTNLKLDKNLAGMITFASDRGLRIFRYPKKKGISTIVSMPVGNYDVKIQDQNRIGEGQILLGKKSQNLLASQNLVWREMTLAEKTPKGQLLRKWFLQAFYGSHPGYIDREKKAQVAGLGFYYRPELFWSGTFLRLGAEGSYHSSRLHSIPDEFNFQGSAKVKEYKVMGWIFFEKTGFFPAIGDSWLLGIGGGQAQQSQEWGGSYTLGSARTFKATMPVYDVGAGVNLKLFDSPFNLGLMWRQTRILVNDGFDGKKTLKANIAQVTLDYFLF